MHSNPLTTIKGLRKQFKGRISRTNVVDGNVCTWTHPPGRSWEFTITSGESLTQELRFSYRKHRLKILANSSFLCVEVLGSFPIEPFSINKDNENYPLLKPAEPLTIGEKQYPSFAKSAPDSLDHKALFSKNSFTRLISELDLRPAESVHFMGNVIYVYLEHPSTQRVLSVIDDLTAVAGDIERPMEGPDLGALPVQFKPIIPLIKKWAIDDDSDREDALATSTNSVLKSLVAKVSPFLQSIDSYLDSFGGHPSEAACALGRLAECTLEAKRLLEERTSKGS